MDFIGTEVGIKIRSAIKAKLTELDKTVDDELIDYIMVMVANKKEEKQMARDLQPFLESDTVDFTSWLHVILRKLEQVTVIVTDDEFKLATNVFDTKLGKKRKSTDSSSSKKKSTRDEHKEKKKKHSKHSKLLESDKITAAVSKVVIDKKSKLGSESKVSKSKKTDKVEMSLEAVNTKDSVASSLETGAEDVPDTKEGASKDDAAAFSKNQIVQRPVMMVSDDDDDDDDFINIKTDVAEEDELLEEEKIQKAPASSTQSEELVQTDVKFPVDQQSVAETVTVQSKAVVNEALVKQAIVSTSAAVSSPTVASTTIAVVRATPTVVRTAPVIAANVPAIIRRTLATKSPTSPQKVATVSQPPSSTVTVVTKRPPIMSRIGAVLKRKASSPDPDSDEDVNNSTVASVIKVKPRPKIPAAAQAPKNLILRAMADAHRSVVTAPFKPAPEPVAKRPPLFTRKFRDRQRNEHERLAITLANVQDPNAIELMEEDEDDVEMLLKPEKIEYEEAYVPELLTNKQVMPMQVIYSPSPISKSATPPEQVQPVTTTEFLVTLDGYKGYNYLERDDKEEMEAQSTDAVEVMYENDHQQKSPSEPEKPTSQTRQKIVFNKEDDGDSHENNRNLPLKCLDRCRFWPACRSGDACTFHHPTTPCKTFPICSFGDKCLYIHPNCKFDASCTRKDCPFTHASPRNLSAVSIVPPVPVIRPTQRPVTVTCRFFPNCSNTNCRFYHPKPCRYGRLCSKPDCTFMHSEFPTKDKMKWVSNVK